MNLRKQGLAALLLSLAITLLVIAGCSKKTIGDIPVNEPPVVNIVNIPPNQSYFTQNPEIFWYGTDIDGYIVAYEYLVVRVDTLQSLGIDPFNATDLRSFADSTHRPWNTIVVADAEGSPTRQRIKLYADEDPNVAVEQAFFVRAVDDDSSRSEVDFRLYSRSNNPPDTKISVSGGPVFWDLPDTTAGFKGITLRWEGTDELDFSDGTGQTPTFEFYFQLFGPYDYLDTTDLIGTLDTLDLSKLIMTSYDTTTGSDWISAEQTTVFNLFRNAPASDTSRTAWFVGKVTARDDAFVSDLTPAFVAFKVVSPKFEHDLVINLPTVYSTTAQGGSVVQYDSVYESGVWVPIHPADSMVAYARSVFEDAGYGDALFLTPSDAVRLPSRELLARYKNYILLDEGASEDRRGLALTKAHYDLLAEYMNLGGNVWVWSPIPFVAFIEGQDPGFSGFTALDMPVKYFDVTGQYTPRWGSTYQNWYFSLPEVCTDSCGIFKSANDQFVRALAIQGKGFTDLTPNVGEVRFFYSDFNQSQDPTVYQGDYIPYNFKGVPGTSYFSRDLFSEPLFLFGSYYGDFVPDSLKPYIESYQGRVCGLRYDAQTYKSAVFGFTWWLLPHDQTVAVIQKMMEWFKQ